MIDLGPAAQQVASLLDGITDRQLDAPTPCTDYTLGDLLDHVGGLSLAFTGAATKEVLPNSSSGQLGDAARLGDDWRTRIPRQLTALAEAWRREDAWQGMTQAGGIEMPGEIAGRVALNELVVHGWDVAAARGRRFDCDPATLAAAEEFGAVMFADDADRGDAFGPAVPVPADAPNLDRLVGLNGRDPSWSAP
jgi:uncharacterized protein (TIGR03086 family)